MSGRGLGQRFVLLGVTAIGLCSSWMAGCAKYAPVELQAPVRFSPEPGMPALCTSFVPDAGRLPAKEREAWAAVRSALEQGDVEGAHRAAEGVAPHPARESIDLLFGLMTEGTAENAMAIETFAVAHPDDACVQQFAGAAQMGIDPENARARIERAYELDPTDPDNALVHTLFQDLGSREASAEALVALAEKQPQHLPTQVLAGRAAVMVGDLEAATGLFTRAYDGGIADVSDALYHLRRMTGQLGPYLLQAAAEGEPVEPVTFGEDPVVDLEKWLGLTPGADDRLQVTFGTDQGDVHCTLFHRHAPVTVINFVALARGGRSWTDPTTGEEVERALYPGTVFHRVIPEFMIQGGDPLGTGEGSPGYRFRDELHPDLRFDRPGRLAMANAGPDTNGSQFFVTEVPTPHLDGLHTIFGQCSDAGIVEAIARVPANAGSRPLEDVVLKSVSFDTVPCERCEL